MPHKGTFLLSKSEVHSLLTLDECICAVENAFRLHAQGKALKPGLMHVDSVDGEFHIKAAGLELERRVFALKVNGGFFRNRERFNMPAIQGVIVLCDGENGYPLAVMDSSEITMKRTGAAAAVAARYLARADSSVLTICGCGVQGKIQLLAMNNILKLKLAYVFDVDSAKAQSFAKEMSREIGITILATSVVGDATRISDVVVTCTPSKHPFLTEKDIAPGTFIAAMGADSPDKQELDSELLKFNKVVVDLLGQCAQAGELRHALDQGMKKEEVHAELGDILAGYKPGRTSEREITIFDATGTALQDAAAAVVVYEKVARTGAGSSIDFFQ